MIAPRKCNRGDRALVIGMPTGEQLMKPHEAIGHIVTLASSFYRGDHLMWRIRKPLLVTIESDTHMDGRFVAAGREIEVTAIADAALQPLVCTRTSKSTSPSAMARAALSIRRRTFHPVIYAALGVRRRAFATGSLMTKGKA